MVKIVPSEERSAGTPGHAEALSLTRHQPRAGHPSHRFPSTTTALPSSIRCSLTKPINWFCGARPVTSIRQALPTKSSLSPLITQDMPASTGLLRASVSCPTIRCFFSSRRMRCALHPEGRYLKRSSGFQKRLPERVAVTGGTVNLPTRFSTKPVLSRRAGTPATSPLRTLHVPKALRRDVHFGQLVQDLSCSGSCQIHSGVIRRDIGNVCTQVQQRYPPAKPALHEVHVTCRGGDVEAVFRQSTHRAVIQMMPSSPQTTP